MNIPFNQGANLSSPIELSDLIPYNMIINDLENACFIKVSKVY